MVHVVTVWPKHFQLFAYCLLFYLHHAFWQCLHLLELQFWPHSLQIECWHPLLFGISTSCVQHSFLWLPIRIVPHTNPEHFFTWAFPKPTFIFCIIPSTSNLISPCDNIFTFFTVFTTFSLIFLTRSMDDNLSFPVAMIPLGLREKFVKIWHHGGVVLGLFDLDKPSPYIVLVKCCKGADQPWQQLD